jgi:hypothetical protein
MIIRRRHTANFTTISNVLFDDDQLAADEVGILAYLLSRPHNWEVRRPALMRRWGIGSVAMKRIIHSWMRTGWCQATKVRLPNGTFCIHYDISDVPGRALSNEEIREALSLVSSEVSPIDIELNSSGLAERNHPHVSERPPPCQPGVDDQGVATRGVAYIEDTTNTPSTRTDSDQDDVGGVERARSGRFSEGSKALASTFLLAVGFDGLLQVPPEFAGIHYRAAMWERAGWTLDLIDAEARKLARDRPLKPISYFEKVFATAFAKRQAPLPIAEVRPAEKLKVTQNGRSSSGGNLIQAADRLVERIRSFDAGPRAADSVCRGEGEAAARMLPKS